MFCYFCVCLKEVGTSIKMVLYHLNCCFCFLLIFRYRKYYNLWAYDKVAVCDKFVNRGVPLVKLDEKFTFYANVIEELHQSPTYKDVQCIRINLKPLLNIISEHAAQWRNTLGDLLASKTRSNMTLMRQEIAVSI